MSLAFTLCIKACLYASVEACVENIFLNAARSAPNILSANPSTTPDAVANSSFSDGEYAGLFSISRYLLPPALTATGTTPVVAAKAIPGIASVAPVANKKADLEY